MRGIKIGFNGVAPTIPLMKKIHMVGLKNFHLELRGKGIGHKGDLIKADQGLTHINRFEGRFRKYAQAHVGGLTPSYEMSHHRYMMNVTSCCWNTMIVAILEFSKKISRQKFWRRCQL
jgi:hypothetical protein